MYELEKRLRYLVFDTETTGVIRDYKVSPANHEQYPHIVSICARLVDECGEDVSPGIYMLIKPDGYIVPEEATAIHGISHEEAMEKGWPRRTVMEAFWAMRCSADMLAGHNVGFDVRMVASEMARCGMLYEMNNVLNEPVVCTMMDGVELCRLPGKWGQFKWPKLDELHNHLFGEGFDEAHSADADVAATVRCLGAMQGKTLLREAVNTKNLYRS